MEDIRLTLAAVRVNCKKTQQEWAKMLNVSVATVGNWENGKTEPPRKKLNKMAEISGIPVSLFLLP